jgi:NADH-quinone oxidoreductase subunit N
LQFDVTNFTVAAPLLALAAGALVVLVLDLLFPAKIVQAYWYVASLGAILLSGYYLVPLWGQTAHGFNGAMVMDPFALVFSSVLLMAAFLSVLLSFSRQEEDKSGYLALVLWAALGMMVMSSAGSLMTLFLGVELLSLALYVAVAFDPTHPHAREAAFKYFTLGSVASAFILFGFALIYGVVGSMNLSAIAQFWTHGSAGLDLYYKAGIGLSLVGFAFKMALVPFHSWAPDVYQGAPTPITAYMSVGTKTAAFAAMARFLVAAIPADKQAVMLLPLAVIAVASMLLGSTVGMWQTDLKRLMAYSGIANAGYLILGVAGLNETGWSAAAFYLLAYGFATIGVFAVITLLETEGIEGAKISSMKGLFHTRPALAVALSIFMFGLAGLPPTGGFIGKVLLARSALGFSAWLTVSGLVISSGIAAYVYVKVIAAMFVKPEGATVKPPVMAGSEEGRLALSPGTVRAAVVAVILLALAGTLWLGVAPGWVIATFKATIAL